MRRTAAKTYSILAVVAGFIGFGVISAAAAQMQLIAPGKAQPAAAKAQAHVQNEKAKLDMQILRQLRLAISKCWKDDGTAPSAMSQTATLIFDLKSSGVLAGGPNIVYRRGTPSPVGIAQTAQRAIRACAPYRGLPAEAFENGWRRIQMTFDANGL